MGWLSNTLKTVTKVVTTPVKYVASEVDDAFYTKKEREADEAADRAAADEAQRLLDEANLEKTQARLAGITAGDIDIDPRLVDEQEAGAWIIGQFGKLDSLGAQNTLTVEQRNMARIIDNRFDYDWDVPDESAFTLYNKLQAEQDESENVTHVEDRYHAQDRVDDYNQPADADDNRAGHTAMDDITPSAPSLETAEDYYGAGGAEPNEEEPDSFLEGWFDNIFGEPSNNPNDAFDNGQVAYSTVDSLGIVGLYAAGGAVLFVVIPFFKPSPGLDNVKPEYLALMGSVTGAALGAIHVMSVQG